MTNNEEIIELYKKLNIEVDFEQDSEGNSINRKLCTKLHTGKNERNILLDNKTTIL